MHKHLLQVLALAVCLTLLPLSAFAKGGPPAGKGKSASEHGPKNKDEDRAKHHDDDDRDEHHAGRERGHEHERTAAAGPSSRPPGWDKGRKTGWGDCDVPPGLAKKRGCDSGGFSARERSVHGAQARGFGDCAVAEDLARKRGCDSRGLSARERSAERARLASTTTRRTTTSTASTSRTAQPGQTRTIILQKNGAKSTTQNKTPVQSRTAAPK